MLNDWRGAAVGEGLRATLGFLEKLTLQPADVGTADVEPLRSAGISDQAIEDAILVCTVFNIMDRIADALDFQVAEPGRFLDRAEVL